MQEEKRNKLFSRSIVLVTFLVFFSSIYFVSALEEGTSFGSIALNSSTYTFSAQLASQGVTQEILIGDSIKFSRKTTGTYETYVLTLAATSDNSAILIMQENQKQISLNLGEPQKIILSSTGFYDLLIKLESLSPGKAEITLQTIHELVPSIQPVVSLENETNTNKTLDSNSFKTNKIFTKTNIIIVAIILVAVLFILYIRNLRRRLRSFQPVHHGSYRIVK